MTKLEFIYVYMLAQCRSEQKLGLRLYDVEFFNQKFETMILEEAEEQFKSYEKNRPIIAAIHSQLVVKRKKEMLLDSDLE